jgi:hypothetical protein
MFMLKSNLKQCRGLGCTDTCAFPDSNQDLQPFGRVRPASAKLSFPGTTPSTITTASACSRPRSFPTACADEIIGLPQTVLSQAYEPNPERFVRAHPKLPRPIPLRSGSTRRPCRRPASRSNTNLCVQVSQSRFTNSELSQEVNV